MSRPVVEPLPWDSGFLGFAVGRLAARNLSVSALAAVVEESRAAGLRLIYLIVDPADAETAAAARQAKACLADQKMTFARQSGELPGDLIPDESRIKLVTAITPQLERLAWQSGAFSRFRRDKRFAPHVFPDLYSHWLRASLSGELARAVLACVPQTGAEKGLLTLSEQAGQASIGLLAVDAAARGQGIGQQLVAAARQQAQRWGCTQLQVVTQRANAPACQFYFCCGFELVHEEHIYHLWL